MKREVATGTAGNWNQAGLQPPNNCQSHLHYNRMASILLKKRAISGFADELSALPTPKLRVEDGKLQRHKATYLENLAKMFPQLSREEIEREFAGATEDPMLTVDRIKAKIEVLERFKATNLSSQAPQVQTPASELSGKILEAVDLLKSCGTHHQACEILSRLTQSVVEADAQKRVKLEAENTIVKKAYLALKDIVLEEKAKRERAEEELRGYKLITETLVRRLKDAELAARTWTLPDNRDIC